MLADRNEDFVTLHLTIYLFVYSGQGFNRIHYSYVINFYMPTASSGSESKIIMYIDYCFPWRGMA